MRIKLLLSCIVLLLLTTGCPDVPESTTVNVDKNEIYIAQEGGSDTTTMLDDYGKWWIKAVYVQKLEYTFNAANVS